MSLLLTGAGKHAVAAVGGGTPATIFGSNLYAHYDAGMGGYTTHVLGGVENWPDQTANARHLTCNSSTGLGVGGTHPLYQATGLNGHPSLLFSDAAAVGMVRKGATATLNGVTQLAVFMVMSAQASPGQSYGRMMAYVPDESTDDYAGPGSAIGMLRDATTMNFFFGPGAEVLTAGVGYHLATVWDGTAQAGYFNGSLDTSATITALALTGTTAQVLCIGCGWVISGGMTGVHHGQLSEVCIVTGMSVTSTHVTQMHSYFATKYGI